MISVGFTDNRDIYYLVTDTEMLGVLYMLYEIPVSPKFRYPTVRRPIIMYDCGRCLLRLK